MKSDINKILGFGSALAFTLAMILALYLHLSNNSLIKAFNAERLTSENLLAEKLSVQKIADKFQGEKHELNSKISELQKMLAQAEFKADKKQTELITLSYDRDNALLIKTQLTETEALKDDLMKQLSDKNRDFVFLKNEIFRLNSTLDQLNSENQKLVKEVAMISADNFLVQALKGKKEKPTFLAKKAKKLWADFDIPFDIADHLNYKIKTPEGKIIDSNFDKSITGIKNTENISDIVALNGNYSGMPVNTCRSRLLYQPEDKFKSGIYTVEIFKDNQYFGSGQINLQ
jgi:chromosome segregation ATPase